jgi:predicted nucleic acid-binding protein
MNVVDSSGWLEYFADSENADFFAQAIEDSDKLVVPTISLFEVFKRVLQLKDETAALQAVAHMQHGQVVDLTTPIAISAANLSVKLKIPMADSLILATARAFQAILWTQDEHFEGLDGVRYQAKFPN